MCDWLIDVAYHSYLWQEPMPLIEGEDESVFLKKNHLHYLASNALGSVYHCGSRLFAN